MNHFAHSAIDLLNHLPPLSPPIRNTENCSSHCLLS